MKYIVSIIIAFMALPLQGQIGEEIDVSQVQNGIDRTVWKPFQQAFESLDGEALNAIYAEQVLRVTPDGIDTDNGFKQKNMERFDESRKNGASIKLDFWFDSRHTNHTTSYEVGFYRIIRTDTQGQKHYNYGQFHIVLKVTDRGWKIIQDWDTTTIGGETISANDFAKKEPVKFR